MSYALGPISTCREPTSPDCQSRCRSKLFCANLHRPIRLRTSCTYRDIRDRWTALLPGNSWDRSKPIRGVPAEEFHLRTQVIGWPDYIIRPPLLRCDRTTRALSDIDRTMAHENRSRTARRATRPYCAARVGTLAVVDRPSGPRGPGARRRCSVGSSTAIQASIATVIRCRARPVVEDRPVRSGIEARWLLPDRRPRHRARRPVCRRCSPAPRVAMRTIGCSRLHTDSLCQRASAPVAVAIRSH